MALNIQVLSDNRLCPQVFNIVQGSNNVDAVVYTLENYIVGERDLSTYDWYVHLIGVNGVDVVKLTSAIVDGKLLITFDLTEYVTQRGNTLTYQLVAKDDTSAVWNSGKGVILNAESIQADDFIVANYASILRQWELSMKEIAGSLDTAIYYIQYGEDLPKEKRVAGRLYYKYLYAENKNGQLEDSNGNVLIPEPVAKNIGITAIDGLTAATVQEALAALKTMIENKDSLPAQAGNAGKYLKTNGEEAEWAEVEALPEQENQDGKFLKSVNGKAEWSDAPRGLPLLTPVWADHKLNDASYLRAGTFSWQPGDVYVAAYNHLASDVSDKRIFYGWKSADGISKKYTRTRTPNVNDPLYDWGECYYNTQEPASPLDFVGAYDSNTDSVRWGGETGLELFYDESLTTKAFELDGKTDTIGDIEITFYQAEDGHKICMPDQEANLMSLYEKTGAAWYYLIDTENKQFKLPRTKWGFTGLRDSVGGYVAPGLPNITGTLGEDQQARNPGNMVGDGVFQSLGQMNGKDSDGSSATRSWGVSFDASRSSSIYGNSDTVQPPATQMYLYFYVGNYLRDVQEINVGEMAETVNGKVDVSLNNVSVEGKSVITNLTMPDYAASIVVSNPFTCPTDGYLKAFWNGNYTIKIDGVQQAAYEVGSGTSIGGHVFIPLKKGSVVETTISSKFYPCVGAKQ